MSHTAPLREIVGRDYYRPTNLPRYASSSVIITLSCGHEKRFKGSCEPRKRARCNQCENDAYNSQMDAIEARRD